MKTKANKPWMVRQSKWLAQPDWPILRQSSFLFWDMVTFFVLVCCRLHVWGCSLPKLVLNASRREVPPLLGMCKKIRSSLEQFHSRRGLFQCSETSLFRTM